MEIETYKQIEYWCLLVITDKDWIFYFYMWEEQKLGLQFITEWTKCVI